MWMNINSFINWIANENSQETSYNVNEMEFHSRWLLFQCNKYVRETCNTSSNTLMVQEQQENQQLSEKPKRKKFLKGIEIRRLAWFM